LHVSGTQRARACALPESTDSVFQFTSNSCWCRLHALSVCSTLSVAPAASAITTGHGHLQHRSLLHYYLITYVAFPIYSCTSPTEATDDYIDKSGYGSFGELSYDPQSLGSLREGIGSVPYMSLASWFFLVLVAMICLSARTRPNGYVVISPAC
jgi:hypothetical protein